MTKELQLLQEIKSGFRWPVDTVRYAILSKERYFAGSHYSKTLPQELVEKVRISLSKLKFASVSLKLLTYIPWIQMIFITGSVASLNASGDDDIDVWLVVDPKRIWITRTVDFFVYTLCGLRRVSSDGVESEKVRDKFCFNFYLTTDGLELSQKTASYAMQFVDAIPVFIRNSLLYKELLESNNWISDYFPSWQNKTLELLQEIPLDNRKRHKNPLDSLIDGIEYVAGFLMILKAEKRLQFKKTQIYRKIFTTWGTNRILSRYDQETFTERS
ncbi:hypothetical protein IT418_03775 [bacterium]|nr:hypothetical protein [bacterium]